MKTRNVETVSSRRAYGEAFEEQAMMSRTLRENLGAWVLPVVLLHIVMVGVIVLFVRLKGLIGSNVEALDLAEEIVTFAGYGVTLVTWGWVAERYETRKGVRVRAWIRRAWMFFFGVYVVCGVMAVCELAGV